MKMRSDLNLRGEDMNDIERDEDQLVSTSYEQTVEEADERKELEDIYFRRGKWDARVWFSVATQEEIDYNTGISTLDEMAINGHFCYEEIAPYSPLVPETEPESEYFHVVFESDDAFAYEKHYDCDSGEEFFIPNDLYRAWFRGWVTMFRELRDRKEVQVKEEQA